MQAEGLPQSRQGAVEEMVGPRNHGDIQMGKSFGEKFIQLAGGPRFIPFPLKHMDGCLKIPDERKIVNSNRKAHAKDARRRPLRRPKRRPKAPRHPNRQ